MCAQQAGVGPLMRVERRTSRTCCVGTPTACSCCLVLFATQNHAAIISMMRRINDHVVDYSNRYVAASRTRVITMLPTPKQPRPRGDSACVCLPRPRTRIRRRQRTLRCTALLHRAVYSECWAARGGGGRRQGRQPLRPPHLQPCTPPPPTVMRIVTGWLEKIYMLWTL